MLKTALAVVLALAASPAFAGCDAPRIEDRPTYYAFVYSCTEDVPVADVMAMAREHVALAKRKGFNGGQTEIMPDGSGRKVYSFKWGSRDQRR